jgi:UDP-glucose 4-epimerase
MPRVVLVTGVSRHIGSQVAARLATDQSIDRIIGVDTVAPSVDRLVDIGRTEFVRADIRNPLIAKVIATAEVDTVVHMSVTATPHGAGGRASMKEMNVIGTMQLLAACQKAPTIRKLVVKSSTTVYGSSPKDPALFTEGTEPKVLPRNGYAKDTLEVEGYVRGFIRRRPDVVVTMLRFANFLGPRLDSPMTRYLSLPVVPTVLGFDPRLQFVHISDGLDVLERAVSEDRHGSFNVAGPGVVLLSQALRRAGRARLPVPQLAGSSLGTVVRQFGLVDFSPEQLNFLAYGRVVDIGKLKREFGFEPRYGTLEAFDDFVRNRNLSSVLGPARLAGIERAVLSRMAASARTAGSDD